MSTDRRSTAFLAVLACFFLSGLAALLYQTAWIREFSFVFGTSSVAVSAVLAGYMSGLAVGAAAAGRFLSRVRRPVLVYAVLEGGIAVAALAVPLFLHLATELCRATLGGHAELPTEGGGAVVAFFFGAAFVILMIPTALMGATLPLLTRAAVDRDDQVGPRTGLLYGVNTIGAVAGTILAAFVLLPEIGLRATVYVGVAINAIVFALAVAVSRGAAAESSQPVGDPVQPPAEATETAPAVRILLTLALVSGVASFTYEVLWTRLLAHILGGSVFAFATMLASFLTGIAVGSAVASRFATDRDRSARLFAYMQLGIALTSALTFVLLNQLPGWAAALGAGGGTQHIANATIAGLILLPSALFIGATFPFVVRFVAVTGADAGRASARSYAWNTVGAIVGAVGAAFVWIPFFGYRGALSFTVAINMALAVVAAFFVAKLPKRDAALVGFVAIAVVAGSFFLPPPWQLLMTSPLTVGQEIPDRQIRYYGVGRAASVLALQDAGTIRLFANGLPESVIRAPGLPTPPGGMWLATLPAMVRPETKEMLVIGLGAGAALEYIPSTVERIEVVEIEEEVVAANRAIAAARDRDPLADPRVQVRVNDARGALVLTDAKYDAIVSQPSHPWTAGASHLYTKQFFEQARSHLSDDGVFLQWIGLDWIDGELFRSLLATLLDVFPHVEVFVPFPFGEAYFVATTKPLDWQSGVERLVERVPDECRLLGISGAEDLLLEFAFDDRTVRTIAHDAPISTDDHNLLQLRSPSLLGRGHTFRWMQQFFVEFDSRARAVHQAAASGVELDRLYIIRRLFDRGDRGGAQLVAKTIEDDPALLEVVTVWWAAGRRAALPPQFVQRLEQTRQQHPDLEAVQVAWLEASLPAQLQGNTPPPELLATLSDRVRALREASIANAHSDGTVVATYEEQLASFQPHDPGFVAAQRLRAAWRVETRRAEECLQAARIIDELPDPQVPDLLVRAEALLRAGAEDRALNAAGALVQHLASLGPRQLQPAERSLIAQLQRIHEQIPRTDARRVAFQAADRTFALLLGQGRP